MFNFFSADSRASRGSVRRRSMTVGGPLRLEALEDRRMLATFTVTNSDIAGIGSLSQAIVDSNNAAGADTINIASGVGVINLNTQQNVTDSLTIEGNGNTITGDANSSRIFLVLPGAAQFALNDVTLTGGGFFTQVGGAIQSVSSTTTITITDSVLAGNVGQRGGAVFAAGPVNIINSQITGNSSVASGGAVYAYDSVALVNSAVTGNDAGEGGGGIHSEGEGAVTLTSSTVSGNSSGERGGGIYAGNGAVALTDSMVLRNTSVDGGGGIWTDDGAVTLSDSTVSGNTTTGTNAFGGGIYSTNGAVTLLNSTVSDNETTGAYSSAGGIGSYYGSVKLTNSTVAGNMTTGTDARGGGIATFDGFVDLANSTVYGNTANGNGGGIFTVDGAVTLTNGSTVSENAASGSGGGIYSDNGAVTLTNSTVSKNTATDLYANGGGIFSDGNAVTLTNSAVFGNETFGTNVAGGGISATDGDVILANSTVSGNSASGFGGGIYSSGGRVALTNSTVAGNTAVEAGGGIIFSSVGNGRRTLIVDNSIVAGNSDNGTAPDFEVPSGLFSIRAVLNSIIGDTTGTGLTAGSNNQLNVDFTTVLETEVVNGATVPLLTDNGGLVETIGLLASSPAIDAGDNALARDDNGNPLPTDQRGAGFNRIVSGTVDIGAFEFGNAAGTAPVITSIIRDEGGVLSRPDLINTYAVTFDQGVSVSQDDLFIFNETLGTSVDSSNVTFSYVGGSRTATWSFGSLVLNPAFYTFALSSDINGVAGGLALDGNGDGVGGDNRNEDVYVAIPGDANLDGQVNVLRDAFALVANLRTTGGATWANGDFNGDGNVNVLRDAFVLVAYLGTNVLPPASSIANLATFSLVAQSPLLFQSSQQQTASVVDDSEDERAAQYGTTVAPALAGSQDLDAAFASDDLIEAGVY